MWNSVASRKRCAGLPVLSIFALSLGLMGVVWIDHFRDLLAMFG